MPAHHQSYDAGFMEQVTFLEGKSIEQVEHALAQREATVDERVPYNKGGNDATRDVLERLRKDASS